MAGSSNLKVATICDGVREQSCGIFQWSKSGYRNPGRNDAVGGSQGVSTKGAAIDFVMTDVALGHIFALAY